MGKKQLIYDYQQYLLGNAEILRTGLSEGTVFEIDKRAKEILRYVIEDVLEWSPLEMQYKFSSYYTEAFKLKPVLNAIILPSEADEDDYPVYAYLLYPSKVELSLTKLVINKYNKLIHSNGARRATPNFFFDENGKERAKICLRYLISSSDDFSGIADAYEFFSTFGKEYLHKHRLKTVCETYWPNALEFLHDSLPESSESELYYHMCKITSAFRSIKDT